MMFIYFIYILLNTTYRFNSFFNMKKDQWQYLLIYLKFHYSGGHYFREIIQQNEFKATETRLTTNRLNNLSIMAQNLRTISKRIKKSTFLQ